MKCFVIFCGLTLLVGACKPREARLASEKSDFSKEVRRISESLLPYAYAFDPDWQKKSDLREALKRRYELDPSGEFRKIEKVIKRLDVKTSVVNQHALKDPLSKKVDQDHLKLHFAITKKFRELVAKRFKKLRSSRMVESDRALEKRKALAVTFKAAGVLALIKQFKGDQTTGEEYAAESLKNILNPYHAGLKLKYVLQSKEQLKDSSFNIRKDAQAVYKFLRMTEGPEILEKIRFDLMLDIGIMKIGKLKFKKELIDEAIKRRKTLLTVVRGAVRAGWDWDDLAECLQRDPKISPMFKEYNMVAVGYDKLPYQGIYVLIKVPAHKEMVPELDIENQKVTFFEVQKPDQWQVKFFQAGLSQLQKKGGDAPYQTYNMQLDLINNEQVPDRKVTTTMNKRLFFDMQYGKACDVMPFRPTNADGSFADGYTPEISLRDVDIMAVKAVLAGPDESNYMNSIASIFGGKPSKPLPLYKLAKMSPQQRKSYRPPRVPINEIFGGLIRQCQFFKVPQWRPARSHNLKPCHVYSKETTKGIWDPDLNFEAGGEKFTGALKDKNGKYMKGKYRTMR